VTGPGIDLSTFDPRTFNPNDPRFIEDPYPVYECIGAPLAMTVVPAAIKGLLTLPDLRNDGLVQWQPDPSLRGITSLPLAYGR
jgi:hypothetical protein